MEGFPRPAAGSFFVDDVVTDEPSVLVPGRGFEHVRVWVGGLPLHEQGVRAAGGSTIDKR